VDKAASDESDTLAKEEGRLHGVKRETPLRVGTGQGLCKTNPFKMPGVSGAYMAVHRFHLETSRILIWPHPYLCRCNGPLM
jgi:hypothetical protein